MRRATGFLAILLLALTMAACATLFTGTKDTITFESNPSGATLLIDGLEVGETPLTVPVKRSISDKTVILRMDGYRDRAFTLSKEFNLISILNLSNIFGWGIDAVTGAAMKYDRFNYEIDLERRAAMAQELGVNYVVLADELIQDDAGNWIIPRTFGGTVAIIDPVTNQVMIAK